VVTRVFSCDRQQWVSVRNGESRKDELVTPLRNVVYVTYTGEAREVGYGNDA